MNRRTDNDFVNYTSRRRNSWDELARRKEQHRGLGSYYHQRLQQIYQFYVEPNQSVLEIGCAEGDLLASISPNYGVGIDFSAEMIQRASQRHPNLTFIHADAHAIPIIRQFDVIILSDLLDDLWDAQALFEQLRDLISPHGRIILNSYSRLWEIPLNLAQNLDLATPRLTQNWLTPYDIQNLMELADFEVIQDWEEILMPLYIPFATSIFNKVVVRFPIFRHFGLTNFMIFRPTQRAVVPVARPSVSIIVAARNEAGNIQALLDRTPVMGNSMEIVFIEGHSKDDTYQVIQEAIESRQLHGVRLLKQTGVGKGNAVREGFASAHNEVLMILDADLTVAPEDLPRFYRALVTGKADFVNGSRLVYPMQDEAMRFANVLGNKFFSFVFSWLIGQPIKDTLCGTKVLWREDYERIVNNRTYFGDFDPFGDFDLLLGAAKLTLKIRDLPIRYRARTYGTTNIQRWRHGLLLLRMVVFAARRLKFI